jgi:hypothetical protein
MGVHDDSRVGRAVRRPGGTPLADGPAEDDPVTQAAAIVVSPEPLQSDRDWMLNRTVIHKIVVALRAPHPGLSDLLDELARAHGTLQSLSVRPVGAAFEAVLNVTRLSPEQARRLVDRFAGHPQTASASIEHMLVR